MSAPAPPPVGAFPSPPGGFAPAPPPATRRNAELLLMAFASALGVIALILVQAGQNQHVTATMVGVAAAAITLFALAHLAVRRLAPFADPLLLPIVVALNSMSIVLVHRLDLSSGPNPLSSAAGAPAHDAVFQLSWTATGLLVFVLVLAFLRDYRTLARYANLLGVLGVVALLAPALLSVRWSETNAARIWLRLPGLSIQPVELAKVALTVTFAAVLVSRRELFTATGRHMFHVDLPRVRHLGPIVLVWLGALAVLLFEQDTGVALLIFTTALALVYITTERVGWLLVGAVLLVVGFGIGYRFASEVRLHVTTWLHPSADYHSTGYQILQSLFGLATGGLAGTGLGSGRPDQVPLAKTDFIIATIGEELGLIGLTAVLVLFAALVLRGMRTALAVRDSFGKLLAAGLTFTLGVQVFLVAAGVTKLLPTTGMATPFLSYGGSALVANYALVAVLMKISDAARAPAPARRRDPAPQGQRPTALLQPGKGEAA